MDFLKRDKNIWLGAAELFDLPPDLVAGLPHMEMLGDRYFYMERHKGILSYSGGSGAGCAPGKRACPSSAPPPCRSRCACSAAAAASSPAGSW